MFSGPRWVGWFGTISHGARGTVCLDTNTAYDASSFVAAIQADPRQLTTMTPMRGFTFDYKQILADAICADYDDNYDDARFGALAPERKSLKSLLRSALAAAGLKMFGAKAMAARHAATLVRGGVGFRRATSSRP